MCYEYNILLVAKIDKMLTTDQKNKKQIVDSLWYGFITFHFQKGALAGTRNIHLQIIQKAIPNSPNMLTFIK